MDRSRSIDRSVNPYESNDPSIYPSIYLSIYLSIFIAVPIWQQWTSGLIKLWLSWSQCVKIVVNISSEKQRVEQQQRRDEEKRRWLDDDRTPAVSTHHPPGSGPAQHTADQPTWDDLMLYINLYLPQWQQPVSDRIRPIFVIFAIRALWRSGLSGCQKLQMTA